MEGDSPPAPIDSALAADRAHSGPLDAATSTADRAVVSDTGVDELYGRRRSGGALRRPPSRAASLLERDETTEVCPTHPCVGRRGPVVSPELFHAQRPSQVNCIEHDVNGWRQCAC